MNALVPKSPRRALGSVASHLVVPAVIAGAGENAARRFLEAGGSLENAQAMAAHESPRTTKLHDRTDDAITLDEVERITI
jgi:hypothetical protein